MAAAAPTDPHARGTGGQSIGGRLSVGYACLNDQGQGQQERLEQLRHALLNAGAERALVERQQRRGSTVGPLFRQLRQLISHGQVHTLVTPSQELLSSNLELVLDLAQACVLESKRAAEVGLPEEEEPLRDALAAALDDGRALAVFERVLEGQGGDVAALHAPERLAGMHDTARSGERAETTGLITAIDALDVGLAAAALGGGRGANGEAPHPGVGVVLGKKIGDRVAAGEVWAWLHHAGGSDVEAARGLLDRALVVAPE